MKRIVAFILVIIMVWSGGVVSLADAYAQTIPRLVEKGDGYELYRSAKGTNVLTISGGDAPGGEAVAWENDGSRFKVGGKNRSLSMRRSYDKNQELISDTFGDVGISFAPIMNDAVSVPDLDAGVMEAALVSVPEEENQTASNVLQVPIKARKRPSRIDGTLGGGRGRGGEGAAAPVTYPGLFDDQSDVRITAKDNGVKEDIIIHGYNGNHVYRYRIELQGLTAKQSGQEILLLDAQGEERGQIHAPYMDDAAGRHSTAIGVSLVRDGGGYILEYTPDDEWMQNASYPVTLDPSYTMRGYTDGVKPFDIYDDSTGTRYAHNSYYLEIGSGATAFVGIYPDRIPFHDIFEGRSTINITSATLNVKPSLGGTGVHVHKVTGGSWAEGDITPSWSPAYGPVVSSGTVASQTSIDILPIVREWFDIINPSPIYGLALTADNLIYLYSTNHAQGGDTLSITLTWDAVKPEETKVTINSAIAEKLPGVDNVALKVSWSAIGNADGYYVGIANGKTTSNINNYSWVYVDGKNNTTFTTQGQRMWPTAAEFNAGNPVLHTDDPASARSGTDFPIFPTQLYKSVPGQPMGTDLNWYVAVTPAFNKHAVDPAQYGATATVINTALPPNQPSITVTPTLTNQATVSLSWEGATDYDSTGTLRNDLGPSGRMEYRHYQDPANKGDTWISAQSNQSQGTYALPIDGLAQGLWYVEMRAIDSDNFISTISNSKFFTKDTLGPSQPTVSLTLTDPVDGWTKADSVRINWSGVSDPHNISQTQYRVSGGAHDTGWQNTGITAANGNADATITDWASGTYTAEVRAFDDLGNEGTIGTATFKVDHDAPVFSAEIIPPSWSSLDTRTLEWTGLSDIGSGLKSFTVSVAGEPALDLPLTPMDNEQELSVEDLADGDYIITVNAEDYAGHITTADLPVYVDRTNPDISILYPLDGASIGGVVEIYGMVQDLSIANWTLTAIGADGQREQIASGDANQAAGLLGVWNANRYVQDERVQILLEAQDEAGNASEVSNVYIRVDRTIQSLSGEVKILTPIGNESLIPAQSTGSYTMPAPQNKAYVYIDGVFEKHGDTDNSTFTIDNVRYAENSVHSLSMIVRGTDGIAYYSDGLGTESLMSDVFSDTAYLQSFDGIVFSSTGAAAVSQGSGTLITNVFESLVPIQALRLKVTESIGIQGSISYYYSVDQGAAWIPFSPTEDAIFEKPYTKVQLRADITGDAMLRGWEAQSVTELQPQRFISTMLRPVYSAAITKDNQMRRAIEEITTNLPETAVNRWLWNDDVIFANALQYDVTRAAQERTGHNLRVIGISGDQVLYGGDSAETSILLREARNDAGTIISGPITLSKSVQALRLEALSSSGTGSYAFSSDGSQWTQIEPNAYVVIDSAAQLWLKAEMPLGSVLRGWHLEGVTVGEKAIRAEILKPIAWLNVADYGDYFTDKSLCRYDLTWADLNEKDETLKYTQLYEVYRNGVKLTETTKTNYTDNDYIQNAVYSVRIVRRYSPTERYSLRQSPVVSGQVQGMVPAPVYPDVVYIQQEYTQAQYLDDLYGGGYTFDPNATPPSAAVLRGQFLLGAAAHCFLGFEPINFNTGNFFIMARDYSHSELGDAQMNISRTYNTQSTELNGPFGARWSSELAMHLVLYGEGDVGLRDSEGALNLFYRQEAGGYITENEKGRVLTLETGKTEYHIRETDGTVYVFSTAGLLKAIRKGQTDIMTVERDKKGLITALCGASGTRLPVEMDANGHIVCVQLPDGGEIGYEYQGNDLVSVTDVLGSKTRYVYDKEGRMTEWFDASGEKQVYNKYDDMNRVIYQEDALKGKYKLTYYEDRTITTDAEGNEQTVVFDEQLRSLIEIDAKGNTVAYTYGENGQRSSVTNALGQVTAYEYDVRGNMIKMTSHDGSSVTWRYDEQDNLLAHTDQLGNTTAYTYDANGNRLTQQNPDGGVTGYAYNAQNQVMSITNPLGSKTEYSYDGANLVSVTDANGNKTAYEYDGNGFVQKVTDALGNVTTYENDTKGNVEKLTFADGTSITYTYDAMDRQTSMTDPLGNVTRYKYDALGNLVETTFPDGTKETAAYTPSYRLKSVSNALKETTAYTYDENGNRLSVKDPMGAVTETAYDALNRAISTTYANGSVETYTYNDTGLLSASTDVQGRVNRFNYDAAGNLVSRVLPNGAVLINEYDAMNRLVKQTDVSGGVTLISYDLLGRVASITDVLGATTTYAYDAVGNLLTATDALSNVTSYAYDTLNRVTTITDPMGATATYEYDNVGSLVATIDALGNKTTYAYDDNGNVQSITDALGQKVEVEYDANDRAVTAIQKNGGILATTYDKVGRAIAETDANGNTSKYAYNKNGQTTQVIDALNQKANFEYDAMGNITKITAPGNAVTLYEYDTAGMLKALTDAEGLKTEFAYNAIGQIEQQIINGNATAYEYDAAGNIVAVIDAENRKIEFTYDAADNLLATIYPDGSKDANEYDILGRLIKTTPRTGLETSYTYDARNQVISVSQGDRTTAYEYDLLNRPTKITAPDGTETTYAYDALGNLIGSKDAIGTDTQYSYTAESLLEMATYANGTTQSLGYDLAGNITSETDSEGFTKQYEYDKVNRLIAVIDPMGNKTSYTYDALDNIAKVTDALKQVTSYTYDKQGNLTSETDALGNKVRYTYTPEGWLESISKADGTVLSFAYNKTGNLLTQDMGEGQSISSDYNEIGMVTKVSSVEGTISYQYNDRGYLVSVENTNGDVVSYAYDNLGRKVGMTYPDGRTVSYEYDTMNRMTAVVGLDGERTTYTYDKAGRRVQTQTGSGKTDSNLTTTYEYDSIGNLVKQATSGLTDISFAYSYNKNNYIVSETRTEDGAATTSNYAYDSLGQLTSFTKSDGYAENYVYDAVGNMKQKVITPELMGTELTSVTLTMSHNKANQLTAMQKGNDKIAYTYDKNGNMVKKTLNSREHGKLTDTYAYNTQDMITGYVGYDGFEQAFAYDAMGMRLSKQEKGNTDRSTLEELLRGNIAGLPEVIAPHTASNPDEVEEGFEWATTEYLYDITQQYYQVIQESVTSKNGSTTTAYDYGRERIAAHNSETNTKTSYVYDGRGSVVQAITVPTPGEGITSSLPSIQSFSYTAFGEQMGNVKASGFSYNAENFDAATGMLNLRARLYEPAMNRFNQQDRLRGSLTNPLSMNRYTYVLNSPIQYVDATGMSPTSAINIPSSARASIEEAVNRAATTKAKTATQVVGQARNNALDDWYNFCTKNEEFLSGDVKAQYLKAKNSSISSAKGSKPSFEEMFKACEAIVRAEEKKANPTLPETAITPAYYTLAETMRIGEGRLERGIYTQAEILQFIYRYGNSSMDAFVSDLVKNNGASASLGGKTMTISVTEGLQNIINANSYVETIGPWTPTPMEELAMFLSDHKGNPEKTLALIYQIMLEPHVERFTDILHAKNLWENLVAVENFVLMGMVDDAESAYYSKDVGTKITSGVNLLLKAFLFGGGASLFRDSSIITTEDVIAHGDRYFTTPMGSVNTGSSQSAGAGTAEKIEGFSQVESNIIYEAKSIINSTELDKIKAAHAAGESVTVNIGGRTIQYEPGLPSSGMTMFGENGFLIGNEAFSTSYELEKTILHELYRLNTTLSAGGVTGELATGETNAAFDFAGRAIEEVLK